MLDDKKTKETANTLMQQEGEKALLTALTNVSKCKIVDDIQGYHQWYAIAEAIEKNTFLKNMNITKS